jgi:hypothetical protein
LNVVCGSFSHWVRKVKELFAVDTLHDAVPEGFRGHIGRVRKPIWAGFREAMSAGFGEAMSARFGEAIPWKI